MRQLTTGARNVGTSMSLIHLSQLLRAAVATPSGDAVSRIDVIVRLRGADAYPRRREPGPRQVREAISTTGDPMSVGGNGGDSL